MTELLCANVLRMESNCATDGRDGVSHRKLRLVGPRHAPIEAILGGLGWVTSAEVQARKFEALLGERISR